MTTTISASLTIGGQLISPSASALTTGTAAVLDGLKITWGRSTRLDQPRTSILTATLAVPEADLDRILSLITPGTPAIVTAPTQSTTPQTSTLFTHGAHTSPGLQWIHHTPGPIQADNKAPTAWDAIPVVTPGSTYTLTLIVSRMPEGSTLHLRPVYYSGPWENARESGPEIITATEAGTLTATITPPPSQIGKWVGIAYSIDPCGPTWTTLTPATWTQIPGTWNDFTTASISHTRLTRSGTHDLTPTVFAGRITDVRLSYSDTVKMLILDVTAADSSAEHANMRIGEPTWPKESVAARVDHVITATGKPIKTIIDETLTTTTLAAVDIDRQSPLTVLKDVATSVGAILWPAAHRTIGEYYRFEDLGRRTSLYRLKIGPDGAYIEATAKGSIPIPASALARDISIERDTTDLATVVTVSWADQTLDDDGTIITTQRYETIEDTDRLSRYGHRAISITTDLTTKTDAATLAADLLARSAAGGWMIPDATWDTSTPTTNPTDVLPALDSTSRIGMPVTLTGVATWVPGSPTIPAYLDGGVYTYTGGRWLLSLKLTRASTPGNSITWNQIPQTLTWTQLNTLTWADMSMIAP